MSIDRLSTGDFAILIEAVEVWERDFHMGDLMSDMIGMSLARTPEERAQEVARAKAKEADRRGERDRRKDRSITLRAKLIGLRDATKYEATSARFLGPVLDITGNGNDPN